MHPGERRVFIADGKGGHQRIVPVGGPVLHHALACLLRPRNAAPLDGVDHVFVVLKGPRRAGR